MIMEIPNSNASKRIEEELIQWVLNNLKEHDSVQILQRTEGYEAGNWCGSSPHDGWHKSTFKCVDNVCREFRRKGYLVQERCSMRYPTAYITFTK